MRISKMILALPILILAIALTSCTSTKKIPPPDVTKQIELKPFYELRNNMVIPVVLRQSKTSEVWLIGPEHLIRSISVQQNGSSLVLYSRGDATELSRVQVIVCNPQFRLIKQFSTGPIYGSQLQMDDAEIISNSKGLIHLINIKSKKMQVRNLRNGKIALTGDINLQKIEQNGKGHINVQWVNSDKLDIVGIGPGMVSVAGVTQHLNALLRNNATLDAKYLRANHSYVNAEEQAIAHITTVDSQNLLANEHGKIYYYKDPKHKAHYSSNYGEILRTVGIGSVNK